MVVASASLKAAIVSVRTLPFAALMSASFAAVAASGASVVTAHGQVKRLDGDAKLQRSGPRMFEALGELAEVLDSLIGVVDQRNELRHGILSFSSELAPSA